MENPKCVRCGLTQIAGSREATRDFVFMDICIGCNRRNDVLGKFTIGDIENEETKKSVSEKLEQIDND